ncbi:MAG: hypothetical protein V5A39_13580 [Haloarculaceae archaeon]
MAEYTLLKLQLDDVSFTANAPFSGSDGDDTDEASGAGEDGAGTDRRLLPLVVGLAFLLVLAVVVHKRRGDSGDN